jgi:hypothetical protein
VEKVTEGWMIIRISFQGAVNISALDNEDCCFSRSYYGYSTAQAKRKFKVELKKHNAQLLINEN